MTKPAALTAEQWQRVQAELPAAYKVAKVAGRHCPHVTQDVLQAVAEDALVRAVRRHDPSLGSLLRLARKGIFGGVLRAAYPRWQAGFDAALRHDEEPEDSGLAARIAETPEDMDARAVARGERWIAAAKYVRATQQDTESPEDELLRQERWHELKRAAGADEQEPEARRVVELRYEQDATWEQAAAELNISVAVARGLATRALDRIRAHLGVARNKRRETPPP